MQCRCNADSTCLMHGCRPGAPHKRLHTHFAMSMAPLPTVTMASLASGTCSLKLYSCSTPREVSVSEVQAGKGQGPRIPCRSAAAGSYDGFWTLWVPLPDRARHGIARAALEVTKSLYTAVAAVLLQWLQEIQEHVPAGHRQTLQTLEKHRAIAQRRFFITQLLQTSANENHLQRWGCVPWIQSCHACLCTLSGSVTRSA